MSSSTAKSPPSSSASLFDSSLLQTHMDPHQYPSHSYPSEPNENDFLGGGMEGNFDNEGEIEVQDYTEGAGESEIAEAIEIQRQEGVSSRRNSMSGWGSEGEEGYNPPIFSGPAAYSVPSSVTSMHHFPSSYASRQNSFSSPRLGGRASLSRSGSVVSHHRSTNRRPLDLEEGGGAEGVGITGRGHIRRTKSGALDAHGGGEDDQLVVGSQQGHGVLSTISNALGFGDSTDDVSIRQRKRRRKSDSMSRKSESRSRSRGTLARNPPSSTSVTSQAISFQSEDDERDDSGSEENWGYGSDDVSSDVESESSWKSGNNDLQPNSRPNSILSNSGGNNIAEAPVIPLLPSDEIFGGGPSPSHDEAFTFEAASKGQIISLPDEDLSILITSFSTRKAREAAWWVGCVLTAGGLGLAGRWVPRMWVKWVGKVEGRGGGSWVVVDTPYKSLSIHPIQSVAYPYPLSTVFPTLPQSRASLTTSTAKDLIPDELPTIMSNGNGAGSSDGFLETAGWLDVLDYRYTRFVLERDSGMWKMIRDWRDPHWTSLRTVSFGLSPETRAQRLTLFGPNSIDISSRSWGGLLVDEVLHPFYVFQVASIALWSVDDYYYYAFCIALISAASIISTLVETKRTIERMREMSRFSCDCDVLIGGEWKTINSSELVPGDIFDASQSSLTLFPCDSVLLSGDAIVNESMLTGESVPVSKVPIADAGLLELSREKKEGSTDVSPGLARHFLFSGTKIVRVRPGGVSMGLPDSASARAPAMVVRTGFDTTKGALVRSMLFPKPMGFKFYRDSMNFIGVLTMIAGMGFLVSVGEFIKIGIHWGTIMIRALDLITVVVPPALPATLSIGTTFAIDRLRKAGIFCISPNRVNIGGKVNVVCFDKTGTLTEEGLDVLGVRTIDKSHDRFSELHSDISEVPSTGGELGKTPLLYALATCHALKRVNGEIIGDPLDIQMFEFTGWTLEEGRAGKPVPVQPANTIPTANGSSKPDAVKAAQDRPQTLVQTVVRPPGSGAFSMEDALRPGKHAHFLELGVIRTFDFVSSLRRMSVIVKRLKSPSMEVYVKGAPEVMSEICDPASFPKDYDDLLSYYTKHGFRVIAIAGKSITGLSWIKAQRMKREQAECALQFLGLIVFENKLKPGTTPAISTLRGAHLACRMVTGDNVQTAISVARECGLVSQSANVFLPYFREGNFETPDARVEWMSVDDDDFKLDEFSLRPLQTRHSEMVEQDEEPQEYNLAVTGDVFRWMVQWAPLETVQRMLVKGVIFARMSPDEKHELVERLQNLGYTVCFCGDGANDCGALKAADVGISLSEAEASVAAPFTSRVPDISCVIEVIKEGRAALVTSFSCFKYMALYSLIQFTTITLLYSFASSLGDFQFLYIDLFIIIPIAVAMGRTLPYPHIHPKRPTGSLVSKKVLTSIISQTLINAAVQLFVFFHVRRQPWYVEPEVDVDKLETINYENSALFLVSSFQYILVAAVFSVGPPYRKPIYSNPALIACLSILSGFSAYVLIAPTQAITLILDLMPFELKFKIELLAIVCVNVGLAFASEKWLEGAVVTAYSKTRSYWRKMRRRERKSSGKVYKTIT